MPVTIMLPCVPEGVAFVRWGTRFLFDHTGRADDAELIASELATNSVRHSRSRHGGRITVVIETGDNGGRIEVRDAGPDAKPIPVAEKDEHGRGLLKIVDALAEKWGHDTAEDGTHTWWAELAW